jgi:glycosyltransferase involved in cell wall biosynthesis
MLSVLIPVFRVDVTQLVADLHFQCSELKVPFEIRLQDDFSPDFFRTKNRTLASLFQEVIYQENALNLGRSITRNILMEEAQFEWMYFLDCDSDISQNPSLLKQFWIQKNTEVLLSGGRIYQNQPPENPEFYLHWLWGSKRELLDPSKRMLDPINHFLSNNFLVHRSITSQVKFDPAIRGYGYEDTIFANELTQRGFRIQHIENPLVHIGLDAFNDFIRKIEESLINIQKIEQIYSERSLDSPLKSKLINTWKKYRRIIPAWLLKPFLPILKLILKGRNTSLFAFDLYRLFYLFSLPR